MAVLQLNTHPGVSEGGGGRRSTTCHDDGCHGHEAVEVDGGVERDVAVEEGLAAQRDEVAAHGQQHVGVQEGDGGGRAARHDDPHHRRLRDAGRVHLQSVVCAPRRQVGPNVDQG